jgi:ABC-2 type transport system permease protein
MRLAWAFFARDAAIALSYRIAFATQLLGNLLLVGILYYVSRTVGLEKLPSLAEYGGNFMAFVLIGVALTDCVLVSLVGFAQQVRESQTTGTLEATLLSPVALPVILIYSSLWNYFLSGVRFLLYLAAGALLGGIHLETVNGPAALTIFILTVLCFLGIGILWAGIVLLVKRGEAIMGVLSILVMLVSGMLFPVKLLPAWLRYASELIPLTAALDGMRRAVLNGSGLVELSPIVARLSVFAVVLLTAGIGGFNYAVKLGRQQGSLTQY